MKKKFIVFLVFLALLLPVFFGIFHAGFPLTDDGNWMIIRLSAFYEALRSGQFPVRFLPQLNNGFGYPVADFLYPLFLYLGSFLHILHVNFTWTIKLLFGLSLFFSAIGCFFWLQKKFDMLSATVGSLVYALFPYHIWDITKRGSLGEVLALAVVPFIFWQIDSENVAWTALGIGLLILSHNTLALLFLPVILLYMVLSQRIHMAIFSTLIGLGLSAFFWFPALFDEQYTVFGKTTVSNFSQYFLSAQLYSLIGIVSFVVLFLSLFLVFKKTTNKRVFFICLSLISIACATTLTKPLWQPLHLGTYVQFPFRFLSLTILGIGFLSADVVFHWKKQQRVIIGGIIVLLLYVSSWQFFFPSIYQYRPDTYFTTNEDTTTVRGEYMPIWVSKQPVLYQKIQTSLPVKITHVVSRGTNLTFQVNATQSVVVTIGTVYYPGWQASIDGALSPLSIEKKSGLILVRVLRGTHVVHMWFGETFPRLIADGVSLYALCVLVGLFFLQKRRRS